MLDISNFFRTLENGADNPNRDKKYWILEWFYMGANWHFTIYYSEKPKQPQE